MTKDHDPNGPILRSLINSMRLEIPVGLILGKSKFQSMCSLYAPLSNMQDRGQERGLSHQGSVQFQCLGLLQNHRYLV